MDLRQLVEETLVQIAEGRGESKTPTGRHRRHYQSAHEYGTAIPKAIVRLWVQTSFSGQFVGLGRAQPSPDLLRS